MLSVLARISSSYNIRIRAIGGFAGWAPVDKDDDDEDEVERVPRLGHSLGESAFPPSPEPRLKVGTYRRVALGSRSVGQVLRAGVERFSTVASRWIYEI